MLRTLSFFYVLTSFHLVFSNKYIVCDDEVCLFTCQQQNCAGYSLYCTSNVSSCTVNCIDDDSCMYGVNIYSDAKGETNVVCQGVDSCLGLNIFCGNYYNKKSSTIHDKCAVHCNGKASCEELNFQCVGNFHNGCFLYAAYAVEDTFYKSQFSCNINKNEVCMLYCDQKNCDDSRFICYNGNCACFGENCITPLFLPAPTYLPTHSPIAMQKTTQSALTKTTHRITEIAVENDDNGEKTDNPSVSSTSANTNTLAPTKNAKGINSVEILSTVSLGKIMESSENNDDDSDKVETNLAEDSIHSHEVLENENKSKWVLPLIVALCICLLLSGNVAILVFWHNKLSRREYAAPSAEVGTEIWKDDKDLKKDLKLEEKVDEHSDSSLTNDDEILMHAKLEERKIIKKPESKNDEEQVGENSI